MIGAATAPKIDARDVALRSPHAGGKGRPKQSLALARRGPAWRSTLRGAAFARTRRRKTGGSRKRQDRRRDVCGLLDERSTRRLVQFRSLGHVIILHSGR